MQINTAAEDTDAQHLHTRVCTPLLRRSTLPGTRGLHVLPPSPGPAPRMPPITCAPEPLPRAPQAVFCWDTHVTSHIRRFTYELDLDLRRGSEGLCTYRGWPPPTVPTEGAPVSAGPAPTAGDSPLDAVDVTANRRFLVTAMCTSLL